jgi:hypothetical protein
LFSPPVALTASRDTLETRSHSVVTRRLDLASGRRRILAILQRK